MVAPNITVVSDDTTFASLRAEWAELLASSHSDSLFLTWEWLHSWWCHFGRERQLFIITARIGSKLVGIAPLVMTRKALASPVLELAGTGSIGSDYLDFIVSRDVEEPVLRAIIGFIARSRMRLSLPSVAETSLIATAMKRELRDRGWYLREVPMESCPFIPLASHGSWESYLGNLPRKHRSNFTRSLRNAERDYRIELQRVTCDAERREALAELVRLHLTRRESLGGSNAFHQQALIAFHEDFSRLALERGWLRMFVLRLNATPAAALYCFHYRRRFLYYQIGFDPSFQKYAVGKITVGLTIRQAFEEGAQDYDFLHGEEPYKFDWTNESRSLRRLDFYAPGAGGRLQRSAAEAVTAAKNAIKKAIGRPPAPAALPALD